MAHPIHASADAELADEALMALAGAGSQAAFTVLVGRHLGRVKAMAWRMSGSAADGEEIAQEAFARVWLHAPTWDSAGTAKFTTWLYRIVLNLSIDRKRRRVMSPLEEAGEGGGRAAGCAYWPATPPGGGYGRAGGAGPAGATAYGAGAVLLRGAIEHRGGEGDELERRGRGVAVDPGQEDVAANIGRLASRSGDLR